MSITYKSIRLNGNDIYEDNNGNSHWLEGKDLVDGFFRCCINRDYEERTLKVLENFCNGTGYDEDCYFGCYFCTELYDSGISKGNRQEMEHYLRRRLENKAPDLYLDYFGEEGVMLWFSELAFVPKNYNVFLTYDEFLQEVKRHCGEYVKKRPLQREKINALLQRLENSFEEAKRRKRGFSMSRHEAEGIIRREGLQHYHVGSAREDRADEIVMKEEESLWHVYQTDENGNREPEHDHVFILEGDAWAFLVCWLREREKGRSDCSIPKEVRRPCWEKKQRVLIHSQIYRLIQQVDFSEAEKLFWQLSEEEQRQALNYFVYDRQSMVVYAFLQYLLDKRESIFLHEMASFMLSMPLCYIEGSYQIALYHNQRLLELDPDSVEYRDNMLFLYMPERTISREQAMDYAEEILKLDPNHQYAKRILEEILSQKDTLEEKEREEEIYLRPREDITYQKLFYHIMKVEFSKAEPIFLQLSEQEKREIIRKMSLDMESMILYKFLQCMNEKEESTLLHELEWEILTGVMHEMEGAYQMALYHTQKLLELEPDSVKYREYMLILYDVAQVIDRERAERIVGEILEKDESNRMAREVLKRMKYSYRRFARRAGLDPKKTN